MKVCSRCGSKEVVRVRHDSDWGGGNAMYVLNEEHEYKSKEYYPHWFKDHEFGDIDTTYCMDCNRYDVVEKEPK